jgi:hypothetical protein
VDYNGAQSGLNMLSQWISAISCDMVRPAKSVNPNKDHLQLENK